METWVLYGLIGGIFIGISNFYSKIIAEKKLNKNRITFYSEFPVIILSLVYLGFQLEFTKFSLLLGLLILFRAVAALEKGLFIIESLKYIDTGMFFPIHKTLHVFLTFFVGMILFGEFLTPVQGVAMAFGITSIILLNSKENKNVQIDYKKGIILLLISNSLMLVSSSINKYITYIGFDIATYMFICGVIGSVYLLSTKKDVREKVEKDIRKKEIKVGIIKGTLIFFGFFAFLHALIGGPFVLVQMLHLTSIFIPIILSIILFNEKINTKKFFAFIFFGVMIYLISI